VAVSSRPSTWTGPAPEAAGLATPVRPGRWITVAVLLVGVSMLVHTIIANPTFEWGIVGHYFLSAQVLQGLANTLEITAVSMLIGVALGVAVALLRMSSSPVLASVGWTYVWVLRSVPLLVQLLFWYNLAALYRTLSVGVPFGPAVAHANVNQLITPFVAAILGLGLHESAYMAEIIRGGILGVDPGQGEAADALGMSHRLALRRIILPQALRTITPPTGNEVISTLKASALVSVLSMKDLLYSVQIIYSQDFRTIPLLIVASLWYLIVTSVLTVGQHVLERRVGRGTGQGRARRAWRGNRGTQAPASAGAGMTGEHL
jgi:polar amino acid transport system permease protein